MKRKFIVWAIGIMALGMTSCVQDESEEIQVEEIKVERSTDVDGNHKNKPGSCGCVGG